MFLQACLPRIDAVPPSLTEKAVIPGIPNARYRLERIYRMAQQDGANFNLAFIGADFDVTHERKIDGEYMKRLFDYAFQLSVKGYPWHKSPYSEKTGL